MVIIYAVQDEAIIWSDNHKVHKAGRVPLHEPLFVIRSYGQNWFEIRRPVNLSLPENTAYPDYWVHRDDITEDLPAPIPDPDPDPEPTPDEISDDDAAVASLTVIKWYRQGLITVTFNEVNE